MEKPKNLKRRIWYFSSWESWNSNKESFTST